MSIWKFGIWLVIMFVTAVFRFLVVQTPWVVKPIQVKGFLTVQYPLGKVHYD